MSNYLHPILKLIIATTIGFAVLFYSPFVINNSVSAQSCNPNQQHTYGKWGCNFNDIDNGYECIFNGTETKSCGSNCMTTGQDGCLGDGPYGCVIALGFQTCSPVAPTGGYGCVNNACQWVSWGSSSNTATSCGCGGTPTPPPPPPPTCGSTTCGADESCCNGSFCYNPTTNPNACGPTHGCDNAATWCGESGSGTGGSAAVPGAGGTGCSTTMIAYQENGGITIASVRSDGSPCGADWGTTAFGGLAIWKYTPDLTSSLLPNHGWPGGDIWYASKEYEGKIEDNDWKKTIYGLDTTTSHKFLVTPSCVTNNDWTEYWWDPNNPRDDGHQSEMRWASIRNGQCYRYLTYTPPPQSKTCAVSVSGTTNGSVVEGQPITATFTAGADYSVTDTARLFVERADFSEIVPVPTGASYTDGEPGNMFYYQLGSCDVTNGTECTSSVTISNLPSGSYYFHCDVPAATEGDTLKCSGNPYCSVNGPGTAACSDWKDCSNADNVNVVVTEGIPDAPTGLTSSCTAADTLRLNWTAVPGATRYLVRVSDNLAGDAIDSTLHLPGADVCEGYNWDVCITTLGTSADVRILNPATFTTADWYIYAVNAGGQSLPSAVGTLTSCIPDCNNLTGPDTIVQGQTATFTADFSSTHGFLGSRISAGQGGSNIWDPTGSDCGNSTKNCTRSFNWNTTAVPTGDYDVYCRAWNDGIAECVGHADYDHTIYQFACPSIAAGGITTKTVTVVPPQITISGTVYDGITTYNAFSGTCNSAFSQTYSGGGNVTIGGVSPPASASLDGAGNYTTPSFESQVNAATATLTNLVGGYTIICPPGGQYSAVDVSGSSNITGLDFYISKLKEAWWQTRSGLVYGMSVASSLPYSTDAGAALDLTCANNPGYCIPFLTAGAVNDTSSLSGYPTAGIPLSGGDILGTQGFDSQHVNVNVSPNEVYEGISLPGANLPTEKYATLSRRFDLTAATTVSSPLSTLPAGATLQEDAEVYTRTGDLTLDLSSNWLIPADRKIILFVDGSVEITGPESERIIGVTEGGFFAVIATGDITIDANIGKNPITDTVFTNFTPQVEGVYIADGTLTVAAFTDAASTDYRFVGAGTFVGWAAVSLPRDFDASGQTSGLLNGHVPTETFVFRPDFAVNAPLLLRNSSSSWREINSLTQP